jgi:isoamylase
MSTMESTSIPGRSYPLGATFCAQGINFSVFSKNSSRVELWLFDDVDDGKPSQIFKLDPHRNRTFYYWHICVPGIKAGQLYGYKVHGPNAPHLGHRFDGDKLLNDPYSRAVAVPKNYDRMAGWRPGDNTAQAMKSVIADARGYNWERDGHPNTPFTQTVIYEMHVGGFTRHPNSGVDPDKRGTYAGLIEKIPYLQDLGITAVELLPVFQFDEQDAPPGLTNYWGYNPVSFFAPHSGYSSRSGPLGALDEFRDMVKALHRAGIEVILDVVYNHTAENDQDGPTFCFRGFENRAYYILGADLSQYPDFSGTGNTLNTNQSVVRRMILDSLRYWVREMHVDGFRFDLASILSRDESGNPLINPPVLWEIESDPVLASVKLIAEAWDAGGLYQVGSFIGDRWMEWNGKFRDDLRSFMRGDNDTVEKMASRFLASPDLYLRENREPEQSINFITCHDGFTLNDLVSYHQKHNTGNLEDNLDGSDYNLSWNCGAEGPTNDPDIERLRKQQIKNFLSITLLSLGVPMFLMGDEIRRTQLGNNNAYCQDNEISWFDWELVKKNQDILRFTQRLIDFRHNIHIFKDAGEMPLGQFLRNTQLEWHGIKLGQPDWSYTSHSLAFTIYGQNRYFHFILNAFDEQLVFELPSLAEYGLTSWRRMIDTSLDFPEDFCEFDEAPNLTDTFYCAQARSVVLLMSGIQVDDSTPH